MAVKPGTRRFAIGLALLLVLAGLAGWKAFTAQAGAEYWTDYADTGWYDPDYATFTIDTPAKLAGIAKLVNGGLSDDGYSIDGFNGRVLEIAGDLNVSAYTWVPIGTA
ncbi:hypothetical protein K0U00_45815, partial [Paenibacillus sepulcri]|nr:hypothetical protein [Paenibacillus sepulcri]